MLLASLLALTVLIPQSDCPVAAGTALPELTGSWRVLRISGLDRVRPDSAPARSVFSTELQGCLVREQLRSDSGTPRYEALIHWGANGADGNIQRVFTHSLHGRFGVYEGRRQGNTIPLRQMASSSKSSLEVVENQVVIRDRDHFSITSRLSKDGGGTWEDLSRWEYLRAR